MLPSEAPMPPWAATVCERVGNTLESTATLRPARASCSDARMPEPPAPTMTTSNLRLGSWEVAVMICVGMSVFLSDLRGGGSETPQDLDAPAGAADQPDDGEHIQNEFDGGRLDVVHPDVAHADPHVIEQGDDDHKSQRLHPLGREDAGPFVVADGAFAEDDLGQQQHGEKGHQS